MNSSRKRAVTSQWAKDSSFASKLENPIEALYTAELTPRERDELLDQLRRLRNRFDNHALTAKLVLDPLIADDSDPGNSLKNLSLGGLSELAWAAGHYARTDELSDGLFVHWHRTNSAFFSRLIQWSEHLVAELRKRSTEIQDPERLEVVSTSLAAAAAFLNGLRKHQSSED